MQTNITNEISEAITRSITRNEIVTVALPEEDLDEALDEVGSIADDYDYFTGIERGEITGTDIWGNMDGEDFRLFLRAE